MVVGHGGYEHGHGYTCVWQICMGREAYGHGDIVAWVYGVEFVKSYAWVQLAMMTHLQAGGL